MAGNFNPNAPEPKYKRDMPRFSGNQYKQAWNPNTYVSAVKNFFQRTSQPARQAKTAPQVKQPVSSTSAKVSQVQRDIQTMPFRGKR